MEAQIKKSNSFLTSSLLKWFSLGIGLGVVSSFAVGNVAVGILLGLSASFWMAIICKRCISESL